MKEFLSQHNIPYTEKYVDRDRAAAIEMIRRSGQQGVPVTVIGDNVVVGFNKPLLERIVASLKTAGNGAQAHAQTGRKPLGAKVADAANYALPGGTPIPGAYVGGTRPGSPADLGGLHIGDIITAVETTPIGSVDDLTKALSSRNSGPVKLTVRRGANTRTVSVDL